MLPRIIAIVVLLTLVSACGSRGPRYYQDDGPHARVPADLHRVQNAVPKSEPLSASGNNPYVVFGHRYVPLKTAAGYKKKGVASWYGRKFHGRRTSSGEKYNMYAMTAAHKTLPLPSYVKVRNLDNNREIIVRVNDRGPFLHNRLIDLSYAAAYKLGVVKTGTARVQVTAVGPGHTAPATSVAIGAVDDNEPVEAKPLAAPSLIRSAHADTGPDTLADNGTPSDNKPASGVYLQVGSFSVWDNAIKLRDRLEQSDIRPVAIATIRVNNNRFFRVRVGPIENLGRAEQINEQVKDLGIHDGRVIID